MLLFKAKITPKKTATKTAKKKCFLVFSTKSEKIAIQKSHIINPLLTSFARSVRESNAFGFYRTDLAPSSLGLYENLRQYFPVQTSHSVNKSLILRFVFKGHITWCNFSCNLQRNSTVERCKLGKNASSLHFADVFFTYQTVFARITLQVA